MRRLHLWTFLVQLTLLCLVLTRVDAAPALTTVQDTLYKADGTRFNGVAYIEWNSFQASDASAVAGSSVVVPIVDGALRVRLVPTSNASSGAKYVVRYHADGKLLFTETWNVIPSTVPVNLASIRVATGASTGGDVTPPASIAISDIAGLSDELESRPVKGFSYTTDRILKSGPTGALETVQGNLDDCIRVDGSTGPCGSAEAIPSGPGFVDQEVPTGSVDGSNTVYTLDKAPSPGTSLQLYRNGVLMKAGIDFTLSNATITFGGISVPQVGDLLLASYRLAGNGALSSEASGALTGTYPAPQIAGGVISNYNIGAAAGIEESKLSLHYPTHSNAHDPAANEKAALSGTAGLPSATNKYVTDADNRLSNARPPAAHGLLGAEHPDATPGAVQRGDVIIGSGATGTPRWTRLPLGPVNRCLMSNGTDAVWNTCLFTGFNPGSVPFTGPDGAMMQAPMYFNWDNSNRRLSVGSNLSSSTLTVFDSSGNGATTVTVRGGMAQGQSALQTWQNSAGVQQAGIGPDGVMAVKAIESTSSASRAAWRESGAPADPISLMEGDAWFNTSERARKTFDAGRVHTLPQVLCAASGAESAATSVTIFGSCGIPAGMLRSGDRLAVNATWSHTGTGSYDIRWRWGSTTVGAVTVAGSSALLGQDGSVALYDAGAVLIGSTRGSAGLTSSNFIDNSTQSYAGGLTFSFEGNSTVSGDRIRLIQFTIVRYPAQVNP